MELISCHPICALSFEASPTFLEGLCTPGVCTIANYNEKCDHVQLE